jgi:hypothetical protein
LRGGGSGGSSARSTGHAWELKTTKPAKNRAPWRIGCGSGSGNTATKDALRSTKRDADLLREARYLRGRLHLATGKRAHGRKDLERVYAEDPQFRDVRELLQDAR